MLLLLFMVLAHRGYPGFKGHKPVIFIIITIIITIIFFNPRKNEGKKKI